MLGLGYDPRSASAEINEYYRVLRPKLTAVFEWAAVQEGRPLQPAPEPPFEPQGQELDGLREDLLKELGQSHRDCIKRAVTIVVPTSDEAAETLVEAVMGACMDYEQKRAKLLRGLFGVPHEQARRMVEEVLGEEKRRVLTEIVVARSMLKREALRRGTGGDFMGAGGTAH
jgi:hypothetical protein